MNQALYQDMHWNYGLLQLFGTLVVSLGSELLQLAKPWTRQQCFEPRGNINVQSTSFWAIATSMVPKKFKYLDKKGYKILKKNLPLRFHIDCIKSSSEQLKPKHTTNVQKWREMPTESSLFPRKRLLWVRHLSSFLGVSHAS